MQTLAPVRILLVEDNPPYRAFIVSLVEQNPDLCIIYQASDGLDAVAKAQELQPDVVLMDIGLPRLNGLEAARRIRKLVSSAKIVFLSRENDADIVNEALRLGSAYVVKERAARELLAAVRAAVQGKQYISSGLSTSKQMDATDD